MYSLLWLSCGSEVKEPEPIAADVSLYGQGENQLSRDLLERSLELGTSFLLHNQKEQGNFQYEYDFVKRRYNPNDSQVRQAGALWGLALIHQNEPSEATSDALVKGFEFFFEHSKATSDGALYVVYPGDRAGRTGTVALMTLALIDFLRSDDSTADEPEYRSALLKYLDFLISLRLTTRPEGGQATLHPILTERYYWLWRKHETTSISGSGTSCC